MTAQLLLCKEQDPYLVVSSVFHDRSSMTLDLLWRFELWLARQIDIITDSFSNSFVMRQNHSHRTTKLSKRKQQCLTLITGDHLESNRVEKLRSQKLLSNSQDLTIKSWVSAYKPKIIPCRTRRLLIKFNA